MCIRKFLYGKAIIALHITLNMKRSLLKYFFIFILVISASTVAQSHSLSFDGDNDYVEILTSDSIITSYQGVTFNFYFKKSNFDGHQFFFDWGAFTGSNVTDVIRMKLDHGGRLETWIEGNPSYSATLQYQLTDHSESLVNKWVQVTAVYGIGISRLYIDGGLVAEDGNGMSDGDFYKIFDQSGAWYFIGDQGDNNYGFDGLIDDFSIWSRELSSEEISAMRNNNLSGNEQGIVGYWNFNEGEGSVSTDLSGNGNNAVINGDVIWTTDVPEINSEEELVSGLFFSEYAEGSGNNKYIEIIKAEGNNLKNVDCEIPLGTLTCITGVSGSGKSTLTINTLFKSVAQTLNGSRYTPAKHKEIKGLQELDKVIDIDQSPIGRTPRSNPATYTGAFTFIRDWFTGLPESKARGYKAGRFSFNVKGGRCEACEGDGVIKIEMHFLPDVYVTCDECEGKRYNRETLEIKYKDKSIADILDMTVEEGCSFFEAIPMIKKKLDTLQNVGLGYIKIGQQATTLSGGEAQRIKLSKELSKRATGKTLYILDEPTTGLHVHDIKKLLEVLQILVDQGNTVVVIEHNLDVIKTADWIIDLGPEGGDGGGEIIGSGSPEDIAKLKKSYTGQYLNKILK